MGHTSCGAIKGAIDNVVLGNLTLLLARFKAAIDQTTHEGPRTSKNAAFVDATANATALLGNSIAANMFMLGYAYQAGHVPLTAAAIEKAIELNGEAVRMNLEAFTWGRRAAAEPDVIATFMRVSLPRRRRRGGAGRGAADGRASPWTRR